MSTTTKPKHIGRNISRIRELKNLKQEALAIELGVSQQTVSSMEKSEKIDADKLEEVAKALGVTVEAIKNFSEENIINYFANFYDNSSNNGAIHADNCTFNPLDKLMEAHEENKQLYERLLAAEKEKNELLQKLSGK